jgi:hypothetical protein
MSVGAISLSGSQFAPARSTGSNNNRVDQASRQVVQGQHEVNDRQAEADRKATAAQQATAELETAKDDVARDQTELNAAKTKAKLDVYT